MKICVYCSSSNHIPEKYFQVASELGSWVAKNGHSIIYGGASVGLMEEVARSFKAENPAGELIGVIPQKIIDMGLTTSLADQVIEVVDMKERKEIMRQTGDGYIALPGSFGTLDEIIEEIVLRQLGYHNKPIVFYDPHQFYSDLYKQFDRFFSEDFISKKFDSLYAVAGDTEKLGQFFY
ncbi:TIGR00730 family Rossman fold protein [Saccharicrinis sp. FJH54]|uniref:LOG family protein n=1 Tax=Saccharicrinis sp. FJH54 TaxID=3344665 RepID=UPI0035D4E225